MPVRKTKRGAERTPLQGSWDVLVCGASFAGLTVARELALFKVTADGPARGEVMQVVEIFRGKIIDVTRRSVIVEITGTWEKIEAFERMVRPFGLVEMARTGEIAISRGRSET